jgi:hypothetical protein
MNKKRKIIATSAVLVTLLIASRIVYVYDLLTENVQEYPYGATDFGDRGGYSINSETILSSLEDGNANVFTPEMATPSVPIFEEPISWSQADYLKIADALNEFVWNEPLDDWKLFSMDFITACHDDPRGFGLGDLYFFKTIFHKNGKLGETGRGYLISPQYGDVEWGGRQNFPYPFPSGWKSVDLEKVKITAEDALRIADENGGRKSRMSVQNQCKINVSLSGYTNWEVYIYSYKTGNSIFRMVIDPYTGKVIK